MEQARLKSLLENALELIFEEMSFETKKEFYDYLVKEVKITKEEIKMLDLYLEFD